MNKFQNNLTTAPIPRLIRQIAVPASVGFFFNTMYNITDTFWAGRVSDLAISALSLSFPVFFLIIALGSGISTGATALISNYLGENNEKKAKVIGIQAVTFSFFVAVILSFLGIISSSYFLRLLGATGEYLDISKGYIDIIFLGTIFFLFTFVLNSQLTSRGNTKVFRNLLIVGFFLNIGLDPLFIFGGFGLPALGVTGVAWATVLIQAILSGYLLYKIVQYKILKWEDFKKIAPQIRIFGEIARQGIPASLNMMSVALGFFVITYFISRFGPDAVAAFGIATRVDQIALLPNIGLNIATLTLIGQNFGARKMERVREIFFKNIKYGIFMVSLGVFSVFFFGEYIIRFFTDDPNTIAYGREYFKIFAFSYWAFVIIFITGAAFQGMKKPAFVLVLALFRQLLAPLAAFYVLTDVFDLGIRSIWIALLLIIWSSAIFSWIWVRKTLRKTDLMG
jgi:putative MATE family efflux protein